MLTDEQWAGLGPLVEACRPPAKVPPSNLRNEQRVACPAGVYVNRNRVGRLWARLKEWRAAATRYEKTARPFLGVLCLAATIDWLKPRPERT